MADNPPPLDAARAWSDAVRLLNGQREILLTIAGFFIMLPALLLNVLRPFAPSGGRARLMAELFAWTNDNLVWVVLVALLAALGRLAILILLLGPGRPTVKDALSAALRLLPPFVILSILIGLMLMGGLFLFVLPAIYIFGRTFLAETGFVAQRAHGPVRGLVAGIDASRRNGWRLGLTAGIIYLGGMILTAAIGSVVGVLGALFGEKSLAAVLDGLVEASLGTGVSLMLLLVSVAAWRQVGAPAGDR